MAKKINTNNTLMAVGAAGAAAAAVGAYWLYGAKHSAKHRKMASSWMLKARAEVMDAVEGLKDVDKETYFKIIDGVVAKYSKLSKDDVDIQKISKEMKAGWAHIHAAVKPAKKVAKKVVKKASQVIKKSL